MLMNNSVSAIGHFVAGQAMAGQGPTQPVTNPATGQVTGQVALATPAEVNAAVAAAHAAFSRNARRAPTQWQPAPVG